MRKQTLLRLGALVMVLILALSIAAPALAAYRTIPQGEKSDDVRKLQTALKKKGFYKGTVDGNFGRATRSAVYRFQQSIGIKADGKPGNRTLTALYEGTSAINEILAVKARAVTISNPQSLYYGCTGSRVKALQKALKAAGVYKGAIDGNFGELTHLAVIKYQNKRGLKADGIAGVKTLNSLNRVQSKVKLRTTFLLTVGSRGDTVRTVQRMLQKYQPIDASDPVGVYGEATAKAVRAWQADTGKEVTGTITESQYNAMVTEP